MSISDHHKLTLLELNLLVRELIEDQMPNEYWVEAEIAELREVGGNCYLELIEKEPQSNTPVAKASARCWRSKWPLVKQHFLRETGKVLAKGLKVLLKVHAQFHENYGFAWIISDIDPSYTLGDMALKRQRIIQQLKDEGVFDANRELHFSMFAQRIAVISSQNAAGYGDFYHHLMDNDYGFVFHTTLFPAIMQGEEVERSVISALDQIEMQSQQYDCVVITRGGGATSDLSGFDALNLARRVTYFPLPVITAIGHDRDESVLDMISNVRVKTPTAAAQFLIDHLHQTFTKIEDCRERVLRLVTNRMQQEKTRIQHLTIRIPTLFSLVHVSQKSLIDAYMRRLCHAIQVKLDRERYSLIKKEELIAHEVKRIITKEHHQVEMLEQKALVMDPQKILDRGYSITLFEGKAVQNASLLKVGDQIVTRLKEGEVTSIVCPSS